MLSGVPSGRYLAAGLGISVAVHAGVGVVARMTPVAGGPPRASDAQPVEMAFLIEPPEPDRVALGIETSVQETRAWLGFEVETEHQAPQTEVEQAAMTPARVGATPSAGATDAPVAQVPAEQASTEAVLDLPDAEQAPSDPEMPALPDLLLAALPPEESPASEGSEADPAELLAPPPAMLIPMPPMEAAPTTTAQSDENSESPADEPLDSRSGPDDAASPSDAGAEPVPSGEGGNRPGEHSPSESDPTSLVQPIEIRPGRVAAAQGLRITTVRPVFDPATVVLAHPRSPTVVIEFGRDGHVRRARFLPGRSSGDRNVDQPILYSIYRWTAAGKALESLTDDPDDTVSITMRIILR